jgi:hypothetical protein
MRKRMGRKSNSESKERREESTQKKRMQQRKVRVGKRKEGKRKSSERKKARNVVRISKSKEIQLYLHFSMEKNEEHGKNVLARR